MYFSEYTVVIRKKIEVEYYNEQINESTMLFLAFNPSKINITKQKTRYLLKRI